MLDSAKVNEALVYARTYEGGFPFMVAMRKRVEAGESFSVKQIEAILNSKEFADGTKKIIEAPFATVDLRSNVPPGRTRHAVTHGPDKPVTFYQVDNVEKGRYAGNVFVRKVEGAKLSRENIGRQRPDELYKGHANADMATIVLDPAATMGDYGRLIGQCSLCFKALTDDESRRVGIGPKCLKRAMKRGYVLATE